MIAEIIKLVQLDNLYKINELVEISKGKHEIYTFKNIFKKIKRKISNGRYK
jgi:hypothetical protein